MTHRCRICTVNDEDALIAEMAKRTYESSSEPGIDPPWEQASPYRHKAMTNFARVTLNMLKAGGDAVSLTATHF